MIVHNQRERLMKRTKNIPNIPTSEKGFTIVELLVAMAISMVVMAAVYSTYRSQQTSYIIQDQVAAAQQNLRAAMYTMVRDIQMAGFDPTYGVTPRRTTFGITDAKADNIKLTSDLLRNGNPTNPTDQSITYSLDASDATNKKLIRNAGGGNQILAEHIEAIGFAYSYDDNSDGVADLTPNNNITWAIDSDGDDNLDLRLDTDDDGLIALADDALPDGTIDGVGLTTPVSITKIKSVKIWILARTQNAIQGYNVQNQYVVGNKVVSPDPHYMYRLLTETAKCRNL
jgi:type IV pilus assembly protein PilW